MRKHLDGVKHIDDLHQTSLKRVKLAKDVHLGKLKLTFVWRRLQFHLGFLEVLLVLMVELDAGAELRDEFLSWLLPDCHGAVLCDVGLACGDHLIGYL